LPQQWLTRWVITLVWSTIMTPSVIAQMTNASWLRLLG
jgi:hypothetical protein